VLPAFSKRIVLAVGLAICLVGCSSDDMTGGTDNTPHDILLSGTLDIPATYDADLDAGTVQTAETFADGDIWNESVSGDVDQLSVVDTSRFAVMGAAAPNYAACAAATYGSTSYQLIGAPLGVYFCVHTDQNRYAEVQLTKTAVEGDHNISISFTTWK
jgi:hypothetical protein